MATDEERETELRKAAELIGWFETGPSERQRRRSSTISR